MFAFGMLAFTLASAFAPSQSADSVVVRRDVEYRRAGAQSLRFDLYSPATPSASLPLVVIFNSGSPDGRAQPASVSWARRVAAAGMAAVTYDVLRASAVADFDSVIGHLARDERRFNVDARRVVVWSGSGIVSSALPAALDVRRSFVRAAVVYYGTGDVPTLPLDRPILLVRVGLDQPGLNRRIDSLIVRALAQNAPISVINHPIGHHPFEDDDTDDYSKDVIRRTLDFMRSASAAPIGAALRANADEARAGAALFAGDWPAAVDAYGKVAAARPDDAEVQRRFGDALLGAGQNARAAAAYERATSLGHWRRRDIGYTAALAYTRAASLDDAFRWIARLVELNYDRAALRADTAFASLRSDPRYRSILGAPEDASPAAGPPLLGRPGLVFDAARQVTVLFGGDIVVPADPERRPTQFAETWEWDGARWTRRTARGPSARGTHSMVFDSRRKRIVAFGGFGDSLLGDTWEYDGTAWARVAVTGPQPRAAFGMAYDSARGKTVLFGGAQDAGQPTFRDTWEWDGTRWTQVATSGPAGNSFLRMAYDARRGRVVAFGGRGGGGETWEWDGRTWTRVSTSGPPPRDHHAMTYDSKRGRVVVFGGGRQYPAGSRPTDPAVLWLNDLWAWDGERWTQLAAEGPPSRGGLPGLAYDAARDRIVLYGGGALSGTWEWDGSRWSNTP